MCNNGRSTHACGCLPGATLVEAVNRRSALLHNNIVVRSYAAIAKGIGLDLRVNGEVYEAGALWGRCDWDTGRLHKH